MIDDVELDTRLAIAYVKGDRNCFHSASRLKINH